MRLSYLKILFFLFLAGLAMIKQAELAHAKELRVVQTLQTTVGEIIFVKLPGNPEAGYEWRFNEGLSKGLDLVKVDVLGWLVAGKARSFFFRPKTVMNIAIRPKASGAADLAFEYSRELGGRTYAKTSIVRGIIAPKSSTQ